MVPEIPEAGDRQTSAARRIGPPCIANGADEASR